MAGAQSSGGAMQDVNNIIYIPLNTFQYRFWDQSANMKDDLDGIEMRLQPEADSIEVAKVVTAVLATPPTTTSRISPSPFPPRCWRSSSARRPSSLT